ncbi:MAG: hypothetical protein WCH34_17245 [Bacteroidota bacterium]
MDKKELLQNFSRQLTEVEMKLKMCSYLAKQGIEVNETELNALLDRYENLKKLITELEKD